MTIIGRGLSSWKLGENVFEQRTLLVDWFSEVRVGSKRHIDFPDSSYLVEGTYRCERVGYDQLNWRGSVSGSL